MVSHDRDIEAYLLHGFLEIQKRATGVFGLMGEGNALAWPSPKEIKKLVQKADGQLRVRSDGVALFRIPKHSQSRARAQGITRCSNFNIPQVLTRASFRVGPVLHAAHETNPG
ncbi:hypothetical protein AN958_02215 [Leucoagaricus sp. SymC.cos]|nr:hypothetical protein AN958_02215 [Leucoagaricus sp. SymC.cos]